MPIRGFTHVSLSVADLDRSVAFYRDLLGLDVFVDRFDGSAFEGQEVMLLAGRTVLCLQAHLDNAGERFDPTRTGLTTWPLQWSRWTSSSISPTS